MAATMVATLDKAMLAPMAATMVAATMVATLKKAMELRAAMSNQSAMMRECFFLGWCPELRLAWKCPASDTARKVFAKKELVLAAQDMLPPTAVWEDGTTHEVAELTSLAAQSINEAPAGKANLSIQLSGRNQEGYPVVVKDRSDRSLLVSCYVPGKQQLHIDADKEGYDRAKHIVVSIAKE